MDWNNYRFFLAITRAKSLRGAAKQLGVSHSTLIRKLDDLESSLGSKLFEKIGQQLVLTDVGEEVLQGAKEIEESVQGVARVVSGRDSELAGLVKITMPEIFAYPNLLFDLNSFSDRFPNIQLEIELSYATADLSRREADIAIRCTNEQPLDLVGRKVGGLAMAAYSTEQYLNLEKPLEKDSTAKMIAWGNPKTWKPRHGLDHLTAIGFFDSIPMQIEFAKQGAGVASLPCVLADKLPELIRITPPMNIAQTWVLYHADLRNMSRVKVVRDFFLDELSKGFAAVKDD